MAAVASRRTFLGLTAGLLVAPTVLADTVAPGRWSDALIINALGGVEDPNPSPGDPDGQDHWVHDSRAMREAHASGLTAFNCTLGYVAGDSEPFESTVREIAHTDEKIRANPADLLK